MSLTKHIPNTITSLNLLCGVMGVIFAMEGRLDAAFVLMLLAALFDFCDGLAARLLHAYSDIGKELDSLCDVVSFGVLPSVMLFSLWGRPLWPLGFLPLLLAVFSALRLAKFNLDERQHDGFIGLPTPAAAMICGALAHCAATTPGGFLATLAASSWFIPALALCLSALLVCEVPMFAVKLGGGKAVPESRKGFIQFRRFVQVIPAVLCVRIRFRLTLACFVICDHKVAFLIVPQFVKCAKRRLIITGFPGRGSFTVHGQFCGFLIAAQFAECRRGVGKPVSRQQ